MPKIYNLRVKRGVVGNGFPFDRVYLVRHGDHECLKELFRYALVMPVEGALKTMLIENARPEEYISRTVDRDDDAQEAVKLSEKKWRALLEEGHWVMAVPILTRYIKGAIPRYITAARWYQDRYKSHGRKGREKLASRESPFPGLTYLQTPEKNIRPICIMCPRYILHQNGECYPGQAICFEEGNLTVGLENYFKEGLEKPKPEVNIKEPEIEEIIANGDVSND